MKRSVLLFLLALLTAASYAVITDYYSFTNTTSAYMEISGTAIPAAQVDEGISTGISIGFDFMYGTGVYNQVKVSSNGYITLGTTPGNVASNVIGSLTTCPIVAGLWDDLHCGRVTGGSYPVTSSVQYALGGTAGNRSFIVQYKNAYWNYTSTTSTVNFQIILYENKTIEIRYGNHTGVTPTSPSASIGINMKPGGVNNYLSVNPLTALASSTTETNNINNFVIANTMYVFSPINDLDLTVDSVTGINTPETGVSTPYTVTVRNIGIFPPNEYVIKLMNGATELASVAGVAVAPGNSHSAVLHFAPIDAGDMILTGLVVVDGETVTNNNSASKRIVAMVPGTSQQTVGTGGTNSFNMPINVYYRNSLCETIYTAAELTGVGRITDIAFYSNFANAQTRPVKIWLGTTTQPDLSAGWISSNQLIQVFDGSLPFIAGADTMIIHLQTPFTYNSGNLVMLVQRVFEPTMGSSSDVFSCQIIGANKTRYVQSDATVYDPASPSGGTLTGLCPKTTFYHTLPEVLPVCSVSPESHNFGQAVLNFQNIQPITVMNSGGSDLIINSILANGGTHFSLQNCPALPVTLATGASFNFDAVFSPQSPGPLSGNIAIYNNTLDSPKYVNLTGFGVDATIYSLPHTENFDTATVPALPLTWSKIATTPASVVSSTSLPYSTPNCINMNNSTNITNPLILVLPPLSASFPITEIRVKFRAKASTAGMVVGIGVLNNPASSGTFNQVSSVNLTTTWMQYSVSLRSYVGGGNYIGFKHDLSGNYRSIYIDDVVLEEMLFNDLAAKSVSGDATPDIGVSNDYVLSIYNPGIYTQSGYSVKLVDSNGTELAATIGPDVVHEATVQAIVSWTPTTAGNTTIYTKIVMPGDENTSNDLSPGFPIAVQPVNSLQLTVGDGSQTSYNAPVNMYYKNSLYENIYYASELTSFGLINAVSFYNNFATNGLVDKPTRIWMGMTSLPDLSSGWIPSTSLSLVFDGNVTYPAGQNTITIPLQTEFNYLQDNLVLLVQRPIDTQFFSSSDLFYCQTVGTNRARRLQSDTIVYDPASPATGTLTGQFPKTTFNLLPPAQFSITPGDYDFGMVSLEAPEAIEYTIRNTGGQELIISVLEMQEISSGHHFSIQNPPPLPCIINGGDSLQFNVVFSPEQEGISYSENLYIEDTTHPQGIEYLLEGSGVYNGPEISAIPNPILAEVIEDGAVDAFSLLYNEGAAPLNFNLISSLPPFLEVFPESGAISPGDSLQLIISIDAAGLLEGVVSYGINFSTNDYYNPTYQLDINITVTPREMNANFTGQPLTGHAPLNVNFTDITHYGPQIPGHTSIAWFWDFDNDGVDDSFVQNPSHIYPTPGVYSVKLSVVSNIGMISTEIKELYVTATNEPPILTAPPDIIYMTEDTEYGPISIPGWFFDPD
ncbi:MAG: choice-of-anchor D domain-containing protein, partial [Candidatus Cloacimonetes bacterium]|nr:choice-of-anchor D domain-containing protein [Candidatus Cloacimonadota bacterium]